MLLPPRFSGWPRRLATLLTLPFLFYLGLCGVLFFRQDALVYQPLGQIEATPAAIGLPFTPLRLATDDGITIAAWFIPAAGSPRGAILFCHGNGGNISHRLDSLRIFHALGFATLIFDYRGYGESEGQPSEEGTAQDARAAYAYLHGQAGFAPHQIVLFGRSLGAAVAARLASEVQSAGLILESAFTSAPDMAAEMFPLLPARWLCRSDYNTVAALAGVRCPVLVVHSPDDEMIPFRHGQRLFAAARPPKQFLAIQGDHNSGFLLSGRAYTDGLASFLAALPLPHPAR
ncbi:MAG: alpha/beta hydrolase [Thermodesulfobacteriota bacterium]